MCHFLHKWFESKIQNVLDHSNLVQKLKLGTVKVSLQNKLWRLVHCYHEDSSGPQRGRKCIFWTIFSLKFGFKIFLKKLILNVKVRNLQNIAIEQMFSLFGKAVYLKRPYIFCLSAKWLPSPSKALIRHFYKVKGKTNLCFFWCS